MKYVCFEENGKSSYGVLEESQVTVIQGDIFGDYELTDRKVELGDVKILPPCQPTKVVCIGLNYRDHAEEVGLPLPTSPTVFMKPSTCVIGHQDYIEYPKMSKRVDYECELAVVIKKYAKNITPEEAKEYIFGYTCANDVTARDLQPKDGQWTIAKSFDTFLPLGPWIVTGIDPTNLDIKTYLNEKVMQKSNTKNLVFGVYELVSYISQVMTLNPGDVLITGTPAGIAAMQKGDRVDVEIESIGMLTNYIK